MNTEAFYAIYTSKQKVLTFTQNFKKFKKDFFRLVSKSSLDSWTKKELKQYFSLHNYFTVNRILNGKYFVAEYSKEEVLSNLLND